MKMIVATLALCLSLSAGLINAVAIVVGGKPITLYDIQKVVQQNNLSENEAAEFLVQRALEDIEVEKLGISVSDYEVELELEKMASKNGLNLSQFQEMVSNSGMNYDAYKEEFKRNLEQKYLFDAIASNNISQPSDRALEVYYQNNKKDFTTFEKARVVQYMTTDKIALQRYVKDPFSSEDGIVKQDVTIESAQVNQNLSYLLQNTKEKSFTPIVEVNGQFITFFVKEKSGESVAPLQSVKKEVVQAWQNAQREDAIKIHFQEIRANTEVQIIR